MPHIVKEPAAKLLALNLRAALSPEGKEPNPSFPLYKFFVWGQNFFFAQNHRNADILTALETKKNLMGITAMIDGFCLFSTDQEYRCFFFVFHLFLHRPVTWLHQFKQSNKKRKAEFRQRPFDIFTKIYDPFHSWWHSNFRLFR